MAAKTPFTPGVTKLRMNKKGVDAFLNSFEVRRDMLRRAYAIAGAAPTSNGEIWLVETFHTDRATASVKTGNAQARTISAEQHALLKAIDAGR